MHQSYMQIIVLNKSPISNSLPLNNYIKDVALSICSLPVMAGFNCTAFEPLAKLK